ncbi:MAG: tetratricopeptide repeat protein, partial [Hyphomicrobiales bacterium]|nr:tetratricopeptide repeat protein [Hyphomicrobiales bacterium]
MAIAEIVQPPFPEAAEQAAEFAALKRMLELSTGTFSLSFAVCNSPALRDYLIGRAVESVPRIAVIELPPNCLQVLREVERQGGTQNAQALMITGIEQSVNASGIVHPTLYNLNLTREQWEAQFPCPIIFWLPTYVAALLPTHAADFWRYRSHRFEFVAEDRPLEHAAKEFFADNTMLAANLDEDQKRFRIAELEQRLETIEAPPLGAFSKHVLVWKTELALLREQLGESVQAKQMYLEVLELACSAGEPWHEASVLSRLGVIAQKRGDMDEAENRHRRSLDIARKLKNSFGESSELGNLGVIAFLRNEFDMAEAFFRESSETAGRLAPR